MEGRVAAVRAAGEEVVTAVVARVVERVAAATGVAATAAVLVAVTAAARVVVATAEATVVEATVVVMEAETAAEREEAATVAMAAAAAPGAAARGLREMRLRIVRFAASRAATRATYHNVTSAAQPTIWRMRAGNPGRPDGLSGAEKLKKVGNRLSPGERTSQPSMCEYSVQPVQGVNDRRPPRAWERAHPRRRVLLSSRASVVSSRASGARTQAQIAHARRRATVHTLGPVGVAHISL